jgi:hypothetical protein
MHPPRQPVAREIAAALSRVARRTLGIVTRTTAMTRSAVAVSAFVTVLEKPGG